MPSVEAIDRVKNIINSLGDEPAILKQRGSTIEEVLPPSNRPDEELQNLLEPDTGLEGPGSIDSLLESLDAPLNDSIDSEILGEEDDSFDQGLDDMFLDDVGTENDLGSIDDALDTVDLDSFDEVLELDELPEVEEDSLSGLDELSNLNDNLDDGLDDSLDSFDDVDNIEKSLSGLDDLDDSDDSLSGLDDLEELEDLEDLDGSLDSLDDLNVSPDDNLESLDDLDGGLDDLDNGLDDNLDNLSDLDEDIDERGEISLDEDFGLNEIEDDFLDDLNADDEDDQFSLDDLGAEYNFTDDETDLSAELGLDLDELEKNINTAVDGDSHESFEISEDDYKLLETVLHHFPLNLKIAIQGFLSSDDTPVDQVNKLVALLLTNPSLTKTNSLFKKLSGKKIEIPRGYEKKSGDLYLQEKDKIINYTKEKVIPKIIVGLLAFVVLWFLTVIIFNFVYRPIKAESLYRQGQEEILVDNYERGEELFNDAFFGWSVGSFNVEGVRRIEKFHTYAQSYEERRQYNLAEQKYLELLQAYPQEVKGRIALGELYMDTLIRHRDAEYILKGANPGLLSEAIEGNISYESIPLKEITEIMNIDQLILLGDNYLSWADEDSSKYESARYIYATLLKDKPGGSRDSVLLRMLRYHIKVKNDTEIRQLQQVYKNKDRINAPKTLQAEVFSELAGWLIDNDRVLESRDFILKAEKADRTVPGTHYQYARFFRETYNLEEEKNALTNALGFLEQRRVLNKEHLFMQIDSYRRLGNLDLYVGDYSKAEDNYNLALRIYENSNQLNLIGTSPEIGALYGEMGNLNYDYYGNYDQAVDYYNLALENLHDTPDIHYKLGYINYKEREDFQESLMEFYKVSRAYPENRNLLFAMGNALQKRGDYYGSISYYEQLLTQLKIQEDNIKVLLPDEKEEEWALVEYLMMTYNNLGVAQDGVAQKTPNRAMRNNSLASLTISSEYFDKLLRNRTTSTKSAETDQSSLNRQALLSVKDERAELLLYNNILPHLDDVPSHYRSVLED